jgi:hypothetical protein
MKRKEKEKKERKKKKKKKKKKENSKLKDIYITTINLTHVYIAIISKK